MSLINTPPLSNSDLMPDASIVPQLAKARVMVVGDLIVDRFVYGHVDRLSREAPIPVMVVEHEKTMLGGAGNLARNLHTLGARVTVIGVVGDDTTSDQLMGLLKECCDETVLQSIDGWQTPLKLRMMVGQQQLARIDYEKVQPLLDQQEQAMAAAVTKHLPDQDVLLLSDYGLGLLSPTLCQRLIQAARDAGKPVLVDPRQSDFSAFRGATLVKPNRTDLLAAVRHVPTLCQSGDSLPQQAQALQQAYQIDNILLTLGDQGMILCQGDAPPATFPAYRREVFDVSGAGDTVLAVLGAVLGSGHDLKKAASLANLAASLVVARRGTAVVSPGELLGAISELAGQNTQSKIMSLPQMASQAAEWREQNLVVGLTNGCFDLLHPGHIASITAAKQQCDRLIIALNSDSSVKRLKGESRPIQSQLARAVVLSALANVDGVVIFDEDAPLAVLDAIKPDIYCKGEDYRDKKIAEFDLVESYGGRIYLIPMVPGFSTTSTVAQMAA